MTVQIQQIAPDYESIMVTISDQYEVETKWMFPAQPITSEELLILNRIHVALSQGKTRRN